MGSSSQNSLFDPVRNKWVAATPEEIVRQRLLRAMIEELGFPKAHLAVEKELGQLPHLAAHSSLPDRRADVICFAPGIHAGNALYPLLLVECKAEPLTEEAVQQAIGYNAFVKAYFIALVSGEEIRFGYYAEAEKGYAFLDFLPAYSELIKRI